MDGIGDASWSAKARKMRKLSIVKLESISIDPYPIPVINDVFNINQSFTIQEKEVKLSSINESAQTEDDLDVFSWGDSPISSSTTMPNLSTCCEYQEDDPVGLDDSMPEFSSAATFASCENITKKTKLPVNRTLRSKSKLASQSTSPNHNGNSNLSANSTASCSSSKFPGQTQRQINLMVEKLQSDQW